MDFSAWSPSHTILAISVLTGKTPTARQWRKVKRDLFFFSGNTRETHETGQQGKGKLHGR